MLPVYPHGPEKPHSIPNPAPLYFSLGLPLFSFSLSFRGGGGLPAASRPRGGLDGGSPSSQATGEGNQRRRRRKRPKKRTRTGVIFFPQRPPLPLIRDWRAAGGFRRRRRRTDFTEGKKVGGRLIYFAPLRTIFSLFLLVGGKENRGVLAAAAGYRDGIGLTNAYLLYGNGGTRGEKSNEEKRTS